jgi:hypothetical protein
MFWISGKEIAVLAVGKACSGRSFIWPISAAVR